MAFDELKKRWTNNKFRSPRATQTELRNFEEHHSVALPEDLRAFFAEVNGSGDEFDFRFLPLSEVTPIEQLSDGMNSGPTSSNGDRYFVIVDYMLWCFGFAIALGPSSTGNVVVTIGVEHPSIVAVSFSDFVNKYLHDEDSLLLSPSS